MTAPLRTVGGPPIAFCADQEGELAVAAVCSVSQMEPPTRILLTAGRPSVMTDVDATVAALTIDQVDELIARLKTARVMVLGAAARTTVLEHDGAVLVQSSLGVWGAGEDVDGVVWFPSEAVACEAYYHAIGKRPCEGCSQMHEEEALREAGEDGPRLCPPCYEADAAAWLATAVQHEDEAHQVTCAWRGSVGECEVEDNGDTLSCPTCGEVMVAACNVCEHGDHPAPVGRRFCSAACQACDGTEHDASDSECAGVCGQAGAGGDRG